MTISDDIRCECGHVYQDHEEINHGDWLDAYCTGDQNTEQGCDCAGFEAAEIQDFAGHSFRPISKVEDAVL